MEFLNNEFENIDDYLEKHAREVSSRVLDLMKTNKMTNKEVAFLFPCNENTIGRKNNNTDGSYYKYKDLCILAEIFHCSVNKLIYDEFILSRAVFVQNKNVLKYNFEKTLKYLNSIGINFEPGYFWVGSAPAFNRVSKKLLPLLSSNSLTYYKTHKKQIDKNTFDGTLILSLNGTSYKNLSRLEDVKLKNINLNCIEDISAFETDNKFKNPARLIKVNDYKKVNYDDILKYGCIQLRFFFTDDNNKTGSLQTISVDDLNKLFEFIDTMTKNSINALLKNSLSSYDFRE